MTDFGRFEGTVAGHPRHLVILVKQPPRAPRENYLFVGYLPGMELRLQDCYFKHWDLLEVFNQAQLYMDGFHGQTNG